MQTTQQIPNYDIVLDGATVGRIRQANDGTWFVAFNRPDGRDRIHRTASFDAAYAFAFRRKVRGSIVVRVEPAPAENPLPESEIERMASTDTENA